MTTPRERLERTILRRRERARGHGYEPTTVSVSLADLEQILGDYKEMVAHLATRESE